MKFRDWWIQATVGFDEVKAATKHAFQSENRSSSDSELTQLEDRVLLSATPMAIVAAPGGAVANQNGEATNTESNLVSTAPDAEQAAIFAEDSNFGDTYQQINELGTGALSQVSELQSAREVVFVDDSADDYEQLIADLIGDRDDGRQFDVFVLDSTRDGIEQISEVLAQYDNLDSMHIVSHGEAGSVRLGSTTLTSDSLAAYTGEIARWSGAFNENSDILFYGCDLASTADGQTLLEAIGALCDCDVAASDDVTGHETLGGDWDFGYVDGNVESDVAFTIEAQANWFGTLDIASNLVGHYQFEENGGSTLTDSAGNQNGSLQNTASWTTDQAVGTYALDFGPDSGSDAYVAVPDNAAQDFGSGDFTVSLWYNQNGAPSGIGRLVGDYSGSGNGFVVYAQANGALEVQLHDGTMLSRGIQGIFDGTWNQLTVVRSGSILEIFHNGVSVSTSGGADGNINTSNALWIGASGTLGGDFEGMLDDVRLYTRALSASDVGELVALGPAVASPPGPPTGYSNPSGGDKSLDYISNVIFAGINNTTGQDNAGYGNYTSEVGTVTRGDSNGFSVTIVEDNDNYVTAWVDWNQDGDFSDAGEEYVITSAASTPGPHTVSIATPGTATLGTTVLRVGMSYGQAPVEEGAAAYREFEDYSVTVQSAAPDITTGLTLHHTYDTDASDISGNNYNGTLFDNATVDTSVSTNRVGSGKLSLDGNDDHVDLDSHAGAMESIAEGTITGWIKTSSTSAGTIFNLSTISRRTLRRYLWTEAVEVGGT